MNFGISYKVLVYWLLANAVITICLGLLLAVICLFPTSAPTLRALLTDGTMAVVLPYVIFILIISSLVSVAFYYDSRRN